MLIVNYFLSDFGHKSHWHYARKGNIMLSVYVVSVVSAILFSLSLRSIWTGVLSLFILLSCCDLAVHLSGGTQYVGPALTIKVLASDIAVAEAKAEEYEKCMHHFNNKAWKSSEVIPSHKSLHNQCLKVAAERSLP